MSLECTILPNSTLSRQSIKNWKSIKILLMTINEEKIFLRFHTIFSYNFLNLFTEFLSL